MRFVVLRPFSLVRAVVPDWPSHWNQLVSSQRFAAAKPRQSNFGNCGLHTPVLPIRMSTMSNCIGSSCAR
jgi:hypothetical protein